MWTRRIQYISNCRVSQLYRDSYSSSLSPHLTVDAMPSGRGPSKKQLALQRELENALPPSPHNALVAPYPGLPVAPRFITDNEEPWVPFSKDYFALFFKETSGTFQPRLTNHAIFLMFEEQNLSGKGSASGGWKQLVADAEDGDQVARDKVLWLDNVVWAQKRSFSIHYPLYKKSAPLRNTEPGSPSGASTSSGDAISTSDSSRTRGLGTTVEGTNSDAQSPSGTMAFAAHGSVPVPSSRGIPQEQHQLALESSEIPRFGVWFSDDTGILPLFRGDDVYATSQSSASEPAPTLGTPSDQQVSIHDHFSCMPRLLSSMQISEIHPASSQTSHLLLIEGNRSPKEPTSPAMRLLTALDVVLHDVGEAPAAEHFLTLSQDALDFGAGDEAALNMFFHVLPGIRVSVADLELRVIGELAQVVITAIERGDYEHSPWDIVQTFFDRVRNAVSAHVRVASEYPAGLRSRKRALDVEDDADVGGEYYDMAGSLQAYKRKRLKPLAIRNVALLTDSGVQFDSTLSGTELSDTRLPW
ncbi:hypothetical protein PENSPDRAFT_396019 [Peniophora sp. CONT]|nr:hypothetical protein PENSPDRAFT_396019 [Peniophora sp. CONT]